MLIDDQTARKIERDWVANQPIHVLLDLRGDQRHTRFSHFAWLGSNSIARFWWVLPYGWGGATLFMFLFYLGLSKWMEIDPIYWGTFLYFGKVLGLLMGLYAGWRVHGR